MNVNFRIERKRKMDSQSNIRLDFTYKGNRFRKFIGIKVANNHWHNKKQRLKILNFEDFKNNRLTKPKIMKKLLYTFLAVSIIFSACEE